MKKIILLAMIAMIACGVSQAYGLNAKANPAAAATEYVTALPSGSIGEVTIDSLTLTRNGKYMSVDMLLGLKKLKVSSNRAVLLTPRMVNGNDSISLPAVGVYGRRRYYTYMRNDNSMISGESEKSFRASKMPDALPYNVDVDYKDWMDGANLVIEQEVFGCCNKVLEENYAQLGTYKMPVGKPAFIPELVYVRPAAEKVKSRSLEGSAFIDFPVNKTVIYPDYRRNTVELGKIEATIDSVRNDKDITITQIWLKGYASPESPYSHNRDLAIGRTAALKKHIQQLYRFDENIIATDFEPEDWAGLRRYVDQGGLHHRQEILALIDSDMDPDSKEAAIKKRYPEEYQFMLANYYPALRHTDYRVAYNIREFSDIAEIKRIFATAPGKLSLNELYLVAQEYEPGSEEFRDVFETAVRLFPADETANLNAANAAISREDYVNAEKYLSRAGESAEADYARGALAISKGDFDTGREWLNQAKGKGLPQASETLEELDRISKH